MPVSTILSTSLGWHTNREKIQGRKKGSLLDLSEEALVAHINSTCVGSLWEALYITLVRATRDQIVATIRLGHVYVCIHLSSVAGEEGHRRRILNLGVSLRDEMLHAVGSKG